MFKSLRWRIQIWYAMLLAVVLGGYSSFIYVRLRHVEFQRLDAEIESAANSLVSVLRGIPRHELERNLAPDRPPENMPWPPRRRGGDPQGRDPFGGDPFGGDPFMEPPAGRGPPGAGGPFRPGPPQDNARRWSDALRLPPSFTDRYESVPHFFMVWQEKDIFAKSNSAPDINQITIPPEADSRRPYFYSDRELRYVVQRGPANTYVAVARSMSPERATLQRWWQWLLGGSSSLFVITMLGGMWLSRRALKPIAAMSSTAAKISEQNLSLRIDTTKTDTELMQLAETLNETFTRLEQAFTRQASFTADASHELRTPLSILLAQLEVLEKQVPANAQNGIKICERAARRMKSLVEQLLTLARADAYKLPLEPIDFDLSAVVEECVDLLSPLAQQSEVQVICDLPSQEVHGDPQLLSQVAVNLITNAIQYNRPGGQVHVSVACEDKAVCLRVKDTGQGIPTELQPKVFERFFRTDRSRSRMTGGNGLGLAISRAIVDAHRGTLTFHSEPDVGTEFICKLTAV